MVRKGRKTQVSSGRGDRAQPVGAPVGVGLSSAVDPAADDDGAAAADVPGAGAPVVTVIRGDQVAPVWVDDVVRPAEAVGVGLDARPPRCEARDVWGACVAAAVALGTGLGTSVRPAVAPCVASSDPTPSPVPIARPPAAAVTVTARRVRLGTVGSCPSTPEGNPVRRRGPPVGPSPPRRDRCGALP
jgi:hypothetical protein